MNKITVKIRDIPFEEIKICHSLEYVKLADWEARWAKIRNTTITIEVPAILTKAQVSLLCEGPFYIVPGYYVNGLPAIVCPYIAEIGD